MEFTLRDKFTNCGELSFSKSRLKSSFINDIVTFIILVLFEGVVRVWTCGTEDDAELIRLKVAEAIVWVTALEVKLEVIECRSTVKVCPFKETLFEKARTGDDKDGDSDGKGDIDGSADGDEGDCGGSGKEYGDGDVIEDVVGVGNNDEAADDDKDSCVNGADNEIGAGGFD